MMYLFSLVPGLWESIRATGHQNEMLGVPNRPEGCRKETHSGCCNIRSWTEYNGIHIFIFYHPVCLSLQWHLWFCLKFGVCTHPNSH